MVIHNGVRTAYDDLDLRFDLENLDINVLYIRHSSSRPGNVVKYHCHSSYELHYIPSGYGTLTTEGNRYDIRPNIFYLTGPNVYHEQKSHEDNPMTEYCLNFEISRRKTRHDKSSHPAQGGNEIAQILQDTRFWFGDDLYGCIELFRHIFLELDRQLVGYYSNIRNYISQIIIQSARCYSDNRKASYIAPRKSLDDMREQLLSRFFLKHRNEPLTLNMIADELGLSSRQASRIVQQYYQVNFKKKHIEDKIKHAKMLLLTTDLPIEEIASKAGFSSASYFCQSFKSCENITPSRFRMNHKG
ncbi:MAG: AraC family transcriptional regulator [Paenibacillaceae bacterium]|nr:AraC family transcriptional regulator [Paenibacillaceae bacterium]